MCISYNGGAYVTWPRGRRGRGAMWRSGAPQRRGARAAQRAAMYIRAVIRSCAHESRGTTCSPHVCLQIRSTIWGITKQVTLGSWPNQYEDQARDEMKTSKRKVSESDLGKANLFWFARATSELQSRFPNLHSRKFRITNRTYVTWP